MNWLQGIPAALQHVLRGTHIEEITEGMSGAMVFRLEHPHEADRYLKAAERGSEQDLYPELSRLLWLQGRLSVPDVLYWGEDDQRQYLVISAIPGLPLYHEALRDHLPTLIPLYATALQQIHALPVESCPFDTRLDLRIPEAARRVQLDLVDSGDFDDERRGRTPQSAFRELLAARPAAEDLVFTHGDYCTPNVLVDPDTLALTGFIDWGRAGVADRYQDLALAARSIEYNFGGAWVKPFYDAYGIAHPDVAKGVYYRLLDEFF